MAYIYDLADTWADAGTTFTAIKMNVTDSASAAGSSLMDLQVGGTSRFSVRKDGRIFGAAGTGQYLEFSSSTGITLDAGGSVLITADAARIRAGSSASFSIVSSNNQANNICGLMAFHEAGPWSGSIGDTRLQRDGAANTLAQRNGTNAQAFHLYNSYSSSTIYERGFMRFASNVLEIGTEASGTGTVRNVKIYRSYDRQVIISAGGWDFWHGNGSSTGFGLYPYEARHGSTTIGFSAGNSSTASDAGIARTAAAQLRITNGSTGTGQLIFIVPTTDPGITGALWNNAGTLSISA